MLFRFSLYGFLKNQRYFEPFLYLYLRDTGLSFTHIGLLVSVKEITVFVLEVPSGVLADLMGRRRLMMISFAAYIGSFLIFGFAHSFVAFIPAMFLFGAGDACRTGTHKAMIFAWLRRENKLKDKTRIYGYTRSWSKIGSAVSILIGTLLLLWSGSYRWIFFGAIIPYLMGIINFAGYPDFLEGAGGKKLHFAEFRNYFFSFKKNVWGKKHFLRLMLESMFFEGTFKAVKDYVQPVIKTFSLTFPVVLAVDDFTRTTILVGIVYVVLYLLSSLSSRQAHKMVKMSGGEELMIRKIWIILLFLFGAMLITAEAGAPLFLILLFLALTVVQNVFRPAHISRFEAYSDEKTGSAVLSVESQSKSVFAALLAPVIGWGVDLAGGGTALPHYVIIPLTGMVLSAFMLILYKKKDWAEG